MKLLFAVDYYQAGNSRFMEEYIRRLAQRGHAVAVAGVSPEDRGPDGIELQAVSPSFRRGLRLPLLGRSFRSAARAVSWGRPDLLLPFQPLAARWAAAAWPGVPSCYLFLSPWAEDWTVSAPGRERGVPAGLHRALRNHLEGRSLARAARVVTISRYMAGRLAAWHPRLRTPVEVVHPGVDLEHFVPAQDPAAVRRRLGLPVDAFLVFTVRRLVHRMGVDLLLDALAGLVSASPAGLVSASPAGRADLPDVHLLVGGDGAEAGALQARAQARGLAHRVRFLGHVPEADLPALYGAADLFVLPTRALEGFGMVSVESMACGTPVLATALGGTLEVMDGLAEPWLVRPQAQDLADGLRRYRDTGGATPARRAAVRAHVEARWGWDRAVDALESALHACLQTGPQTGRQGSGS